MSTLAFVTVLATVGQVPTAETLHLHPEKGRPLHYFVAQDIVTQMKMPTAEIKIAIHMETDLQLDLRERGSDGKCLFDLTFQHLRGTITPPFGGKTEFASDDGKTEYPGLFNPKVLQLKMLAGKTIGALVSPTGMVERIQGYAEIYAGTPIEKELKAGGELLTNESYLNDVQFNFTILPAIAVRDGSEWDASYPFSVFENQITYLPHCTMVETTKDTARWRFLTIVDPSDAGSGAEAVDATARQPRGYVTQADVQSASLQGESVVSRSDGLPLRQTVEVIMDLKMPSPIGGDPLPTVVSQKVEIRRVNSDDKPK